MKKHYEQIERKREIRKKKKRKREREREEDDGGNRKQEIIKNTLRTPY